MAWMIRGIPPPASRTSLRKTRVQLATIARLDEDRGVSFGVDVRARTRKSHRGLRALLGKAPDAREVGDRLVRLARRAFKGSIVDATTRRVTFQLHPNAPPGRIAVLPEGDLEIKALTSAVGPGYHAEILARLAPILEELDYVIEGDESDPQTRMTAWLADELRDGARLIGMPIDRCFRLDEPVLTSMGPRDAAWRDAVLADPKRGADAFAWWERGPGREALSRALLAMWLEVPWREPLDDAETTLLERVDADLAAAHGADRTLAMPWRAWAELLDWLGADDEHAESVRKRAKSAPATPPIGYRRYAMDVEVAGGWLLVLGGAFVSHWDDDRWWATDGDRVVELTTLTAGGETDSQQLLEVAPPVHPVIERIVEDTRCGRAEVSDDGDVHIVTGLMAAAPHVAILTCKGRASDHDWALATWRSLRNV
jgi:hypothetical protein